MKVYQHVHINGYEKGEALENKLKKLGFWPDPFRQDKGIGLRYMPPHHYSFETVDDESGMNIAFQEAVKILEEDQQFRGYIESENIPEKCRQRYPQRAHDTILPFPFPPCTFVDATFPKYKACDLHLKRSLDLLRDELDDKFHQHGFYEVHTPRNRIYTIQIETVGDGKRAFKSLDQYFRQAGGVKEMYLEITKSFWRKPSDFPVPALVQKGFFGAKNG